MSIRQSCWASNSGAKQPPSHRDLWRRRGITTPKRKNASDLFCKQIPGSSRLRQEGERCDASLGCPYPKPQSVLEPANSASWCHFHLPPQHKVRASPFACHQPYAPPIFRCECCGSRKHVWCHNVKWFYCQQFTIPCV